MKKHFKKFDDFLIDLINIRMHRKYLNGIMNKGTNLGGAIFSTSLVIVLILIGNSHTKKMGIETLLALFISQFIVHSLKRILSRERPYKILEHLNTFGIIMEDYSFPSGHTAASFSIATTIALNRPKLAFFVFLLASFVAISRIYLGVHYPTDVAAAIFFGTIPALWVHFYLMGLVNKIVEVLRF